MSAENDYQKSVDFWIKSQENLIEQIKIAIDNSEKMVKIHSDQLELSKQQLRHEEDYLKSYKNGNDKV